MTIFLDNRGSVPRRAVVCDATFPFFYALDCESAKSVSGHPQGLPTRDRSALPCCNRSEMRVVTQPQIDLLMDISTERLFDQTGA
jgi:hypothetical protein